MSAINTFKQGHAFLIKCLQKQSEQREEEEEEAAWSSHKGNLSYEPLNEKESGRGKKKELGKGGKRKKNTERKGHEWQLIWGVSATPQRAMTSSGIEEREERRGSFKSSPLPQAVITFVLNMPKCSCAAGRIIFPGWGLEGWINQLCLQWGVFTAKKKKKKSFSHQILIFQKQHVVLHYEAFISKSLCGFFFSHNCKCKCNKKTLSSCCVHCRHPCLWVDMG